MKKLLSVVVIAVLSMSMLLTGCGEKKDSGNAKASSDKEILVVSFGTSYSNSRHVTIGAIEDAIREAYPDYQVRRAFTAQIIIDKLKKEENIEIDNVKQALDRAVANGVKTLVVQPTHLMNGLEYNDLKKELDKYKDKFDKIALGKPLLTSDEDFKQVIAAITNDTKEYLDGETAICFMGHGTEADSNKVYATLQEKLKAAGYNDYFVGTVEAKPSVDDLIAQVKESGKYKRVILQPLMVVAGDHANNDMAGDGEDSWVSKFKAAGFEVKPVLRGLGQNYDIQKIYLEHLKAAIDSLK
ncbi:MAG: sirohydrochlorin cobaltochelatase [[Eubacterium] sulci]|mgnify:FL=1|jgi:cbiX|nr:sirohydrochlorin cobaltochelatase [[Eubacterium] sulci]MBF1137837.1 sirohydrochlorin cobaltochelatase [[Eubacterium] sulci]MBF1141590.1 sirohydrochlorin cobaltochelatase [[Eubacterium] sulci]MBF1149895.1 sirohydrochlorin cobaltochelatase [[Eubacterium] sulci]MBF1152859.1 sirohydrochlorin cobaltochelatase [[Eubacterium] sulci]